MKIGKKDKAVVYAFAHRLSADGHKLSSTGNRIDGHWLGGNGIAEWTRKPPYLIVFNDLGSKAAQTVQRAIRKEIPAMLFGGTRGTR